METTIKIPTKAYRLMAEMLAEINPKAYNSCINVFIPPLTDLELLPFIYNQIGEFYEHTLETRVTTLSIIYKLYAPEKLFLTTQRTNAGIRTAISNAMGFNSYEMVNEYQTKLVAYYKGPRFKERVDNIATQILNKINKHKHNHELHIK